MADVVNRDPRLQALVREAADQGEAAGAAVDDAQRAHARRLQQKKVEQHAQEIGRTTAGGPSLGPSRDAGLDDRWSAVLKGDLGPEAQAVAQQWSQNRTLQAKLPEPNKQAFMRLLLNGDTRGRAMQGGQALLTLATSPEHAHAFSSSQQVASLQSSLLAAPQRGPEMGRLLGRPAMRAGGAEPQAQGRLLQFAGQQWAAGRPQLVAAAADMLDGQVAVPVAPRGQLASLNMAQRLGRGEPELAAARLQNVDLFVASTAMGQQSPKVRGEAVRALARVDGDPEVRAGFERLLQDPTFGSLRRRSKALWFAGIGSGRGSQLRALTLGRTDKVLQAMQLPDYPRQLGQEHEGAQVTALLRQLGQATTVEAVEALSPVRLASPVPDPGKMPVLPVAPRLADLGGRARRDAQIRYIGALTLYSRQLERHYQGIGRRIETAVYYDQLFKLPELAAPPEPHLEGLEPHDAKTEEGRHAALQALFSRTSSLLRQQQWGLRNNRRPASAPAVPMPVAGRAERLFRPGEAASARAPAAGRSGEPAGPSSGGSAVRPRLSSAPPLPSPPRLPNVSAQPVGQPAAQPAVEGRGSAAARRAPAAGRAAAATGMGRPRRAEAPVGRLPRGTVAPVIDGSEAEAFWQALPESLSPVQRETRLQAFVTQQMTSRMQQRLSQMAAQLQAEVPQDIAAAMDTLRRAEPTGREGRSPAAAPSDRMPVTPMSSPAAELALPQELPTGVLAALSPSAPAPASASAAGDLEALVAAAARAAATRVDGAPAAPPRSGASLPYGVQRRFERDLGDNQLAPVRPQRGARGSVRSTTAEASSNPLSLLMQLFLGNVTWKQLSLVQTQGMQNLGWSQPLWDGRGAPQALWPRSMRQPFARLDGIQQMAVRNLGLTAEAWDRDISSGLLEEAQESTVAPGGRRRRPPPGGIKG